jgi:hypothetical protein
MSTGIEDWIEEDYESYTEEDAEGSEIESDSEDKSSDHDLDSTPDSPYTMRTKNWRSLPNRAERILSVLEFMKQQQVDLPLLLWSISWNDPVLNSNTMVHWERTALLASRELPRILRSWYNPPKAHGSGKKTCAGRAAI